MDASAACAFKTTTADLLIRSSLSSSSSSSSSLSSLSTSTTMVGGKSAALIRDDALVLVCELLSSFTKDALHRAAVVASADSTNDGQIKRKHVAAISAALLLDY
eukprot:ANDGO_00944.mRNA.1 hypothetical protein